MRATCETPTGEPVWEGELAQGETVCELVARVGADLHKHCRFLHGDALLSSSAQRLDALDTKHLALTVLTWEAAPPVRVLFVDEGGAPLAAQAFAAADQTLPGVHRWLETELQAFCTFRLGDEWVSPCYVDAKPLLEPTDLALRATLTARCVPYKTDTSQRHSRHPDNTPAGFPYTVMRDGAFMSRRLSCRVVACSPDGARDEWRMPRTADVLLAIYCNKPFRISIGQYTVAKSQHKQGSWHYVDPVLVGGVSMVSIGMHRVGISCDGDMKAYAVEEYLQPFDRDKLMNLDSTFRFQDKTITIANGAFRID
jgi:hypothetical protein